MNQKEQGRLQVLNSLLAKHMTIEQASTLMGARERNEGEVYQREMKRRRTTVEGVFASLDRLGWARSRLRGLWKVNCEGYISALAHNLKKAASRLGEAATLSAPRPA